MTHSKRIGDLETLLSRLEQAAEDNPQVSLEDILKELGPVTFGPFLLLAGLVVIVPLLGDIPLVPTAMGLLVLLTAGQVLFGRHHFWLPGWLLNRNVSCEKLCRGVQWMKKPAGKIDRLLDQRFIWFTGKYGTYTIAVLCVLIALCIPIMELIPFSANAAGAAWILFGLALTARDGLSALLATACAAVTFWLLVGTWI